MIFVDGLFVEGRFRVEGEEGGGGGSFGGGGGGGGGHTVPKRGFSPDFHVVFTTCCRLFA